MAPFPSSADRHLDRFPSFVGGRRGILLLFLVGMVAACGCREETPTERAARKAAAQERAQQREAERQKREEARQHFQISDPVAQWTETGLERSLVKPGHWNAMSQQMTALKENWGGEMTLRMLDRKGRPLPYPRTPYQLSSSRAVQLARGRSRRVENLLLMPSATGGMLLESALRERGYGLQREVKQHVVSAMPSYQYFWVVLAKEPERYQFLKSLNAVLVPFSVENEITATNVLHYQVVLPDISKGVPLPENPLCWTTMAYLLWDEVDPQQLSPLQREALVDWLHWGGELIISGPDSLGLLHSSFLAPYLPATDAGATTIEPSAIDQLANYWTNGRNRKPLQVTQPWSGIQLALADGVSSQAGVAAATGGLVVEKQVGRGRVVVTRMQLAQRDLINWSPHFDNFFNGAIMRREPRKWSAVSSYDSKAWLHAEWATAPGHSRDAQYVSHLRRFARDVQDHPDATNYRASGDLAEAERLPEVRGGIGAWNDFNATSNAARQALRKAAGVRVPPASFVAICLAVYLVVLVPLNWFFFKALGRVELAWAAVPLIALVGMAVVVQQAQLDIGFARAQTEIGLLEIDGEYPRAHLSRYTALYTSLSTSYDLLLDEPTALAAPFPTRDDYALLSDQSPTTIELQQAKQVTLADVRIASATTNMVHSEQLFVLDGPLLFQAVERGLWRVSNRSQLKLQSVAVVMRRDEKGEPRMFGGWIGELPARESMIVHLQPLDADLLAQRRSEENQHHAGRLDLEPLFALAVDPQHLDSGEVRLVGRVDEVLPGVTIEPSARQSRGATLVVAHLARAPLGVPVGDVNNPRDL